MRWNEMGWETSCIQTNQMVQYTQGKDVKYKMKMAQLFLKSIWDTYIWFHGMVLWSLNKFEIAMYKQCTAMERYRVTTPGNSEYKTKIFFWLVGCPQKR